MTRSLFNFFFYPITYLWEKIYQLRRFAYTIGLFKSTELGVPVISVGNLSFGGTGKTPLTIWLTEFLEQYHFNVSILTRGYKSKKEKSYAVIKGRVTGQDSVVEYGDEATMMANRLPNASIVIGRNRRENIQYYFEKLKPNVLILDDGYQHLKISRSANIVLFDSLMPLEKYNTPPLGYLREGITAIDYADYIVLGRTDQTSREKINQLKNFINKNSNRKIPYAEFRYICEGVYGEDYKKLGDESFLKDKKIVTLSAIASPKSFYNMIEHHGGVVIEKFSFPDHHFFSEKDLKEVEEFAQKEGAIVLTTEKDFVKISAIKKNFDIVFLKINLEFIEGEDDFKKFLMDSCQ